jgi:NADH-quinone oxidoreductase subunit E
MDHNIEIAAIADNYAADRRYALALMQDIQKQIGYIPREGLEIAADHLGCHVAELYGMATFYKALSLKPKGKHIIKLCDGTACHIRGSSVLIDAVKRTLGIEPGDVTEDGEYSLELVNCLGSCAIAPVMLIDDQWYGKMTVEKLPEVLKAHSEGVASE